MTDVAARLEAADELLAAVNAYGALRIPIDVKAMNKGGVINLAGVTTFCSLSEFQTAGAALGDARDKYAALSEADLG